MSVTAGIIPLERGWLEAHPLPGHGGGETTKNSRGRVLLAGGTHLVPGALRLTGEAALRAGAGKLQMATVAQAALPLGLMVPEAAVIGLPTDDDGEIAVDAAPLLAKAAARADTLILGPGMGDHRCAARLIEPLLGTPRDGLTIVLDAAAAACAGRLDAVCGRHEGRIVMTPHHGEAAALLDRDAADIGADPEGVAREAAERFGVVMVLKAAATLVAAPDGTLLRFPGGGVGLATGGSGDVLAGTIGGLLARGADPLVAAAWGVWLHGEAGRRAAAASGPIGFLARDLPGHIPALMAEATGGATPR